MTAAFDWSRSGRPNLAKMWNWPDRGSSVWDQALDCVKAANFGSQGTHFESLLWRMQNGELDGYQAKLVVLHGVGVRASAEANHRQHWRPTDRRPPG